LAPTLKKEERSVSETQTAEKPRPAVNFLRIPDEGEPYLAGSKCNKCGETFLGDRKTCAACGARDQMTSVKLADHGKLYNYTIVHRNFPGVAVPFVSAIVDVDGGGTLKGNLEGVAPLPDAIKFDMPVKIVIKDAGRKDKDGNSYLAYFFQPA
jgi:uncharacterized OB-fold protein